MALTCDAACSKLKSRDLYNSAYQSVAGAFLLDLLVLSFTTYVHREVAKFSKLYCE